MNWGKGITIFIASFMLFIASMVYYAFTLNADLVSENYYEQEQHYDADKISRQNYAATGEQLSLFSKDGDIVLEFPASFQTTEKGSVIFYRPDQKKLDRKFDLELNQYHQQIFSSDHFSSGYYDVKVQWSDENKTYLFESAIQL